MASFFEESIRTYSGLSSETKPTAAAGNSVPNGSRWREVDTAKTFHYNESDDTWYLAEPTVDSATHALNFVDYEHHEIHSGSSYSANFDNTTDSTDDHRSAIALQTPNTTKWAHMVVEVTASSPAEFSIIEGITIDLGAGTEKTIYNRNRNSTNVSTLVNLANPQVAGSVTTYTEAQLAASNLAGGTAIEHILLAGGEGPKAVGGAARGASEWILDQGVKYLFVIQNIGANANMHEIHLAWYEHTSKA